MISFNAETENFNWITLTESLHQVSGQVQETIWKYTLTLLSFG